MVAWVLLAQLVQAQVQVPDSVEDARNTRPRILQLEDDPFYVKDSTALAQDSLRALQDSTQRAQTQARLDSLRSGSPLEDVLTYEASDSLTLNLRGRKMRLYEDAEVVYGPSTINAARVEVDWEKTLMTAEGVLVDTTEEVYRDEPIFTDNGQTYNNHHVVYNYRSRRGKVIGTSSKQGENNFTADETKRTPDGSFYARDGIFTTCNAPNPHFHLRAKKLKVIPGERFISGPIFLSMNDVPLPIGLPFGFFPQREERASGILFPTVGEERDRGFFLRNLGYYQILSPYVDVAVDGDIYARGSYRAQLEVNYNRRYRASGLFSFTTAERRFGQKGDPDYSVTKDLQIIWRHSQPINPTTRLSSDVNFATNTYNQFNSFQVQDYVRNTAQSSVNFTKSFPRQGWSINAALTHYSDFANQTVTLTLPRINWARQRFYPFRRKVRVGSSKWYEDIGVTYSGNLQNQLSVLEQNLFTPAGNDSFRLGINHRVAVSTNFKLFNYITLTPSVSGNEYWYFEERRYTRFELTGPFEGTSVNNFDTTYYRNTDSLYRIGIAGTRYPGFSAARDFALSVSATTSLYGVWETGNDRRRAYRHTLRPSLSYTYRPDFSTPFWGVYTELPTDSAQTTFQRFSKFDDFVVGGPGRGTSQSIGFSLQNVIETKVLEKQDTTMQRRGSEKPNYLYSNVVDNLGLTASYNLAADSFQLSNISFSGRSSVLNNKVSILATATLNPYQLSADGSRRVDRYMWQGRRSLGRITDYSVAATFTLSSSKGERKEEALQQQEEQLLLENPASLGLPPELQDLELYRQLYAEFNIPWTLSINYSFRYSKPSLDKSTTTQTLNLQGDVRLTNQWRLTVSSGYDFEQHKISFTTLSINRDLHCWNLQFSAVPFGLRQYYSLVIAVKSSALQDLKIRKRRDWQDGFRGF